MNSANIHNEWLLPSYLVGVDTSKDHDDRVVLHFSSQVIVWNRGDNYSEYDGSFVHDGVEDDSVD